MSRGEIIEMGTYAERIEKSVSFKKMIELQAL
jgi:hypothetical protein